MAIKPQLIKFLLEEIPNSNYQVFGSKVHHLFQHIDNEVKDNPIYNKYEELREEWKNWPIDDEIWYMPPDFDDVKALTYSLYKAVSDKGEEGYEITWSLFHGHMNESVIEFNKNFFKYLVFIVEEIINANPEVENTKSEKVSGNKVFIIHGHDAHLKTELQLLLTRAGVNNIVLHEHADKGRTIIDKLTEEGKEANYAIALLSPDDTMHDGSNRARQNVIMEIGYFMGKLGKERVRLLKKGETEIPSDLQGVLYENYDLAGAWKMKLAKELQAVGIFVDMNSIASTL